MRYTALLSIFLFVQPLTAWDVQSQYSAKVIDRNIDTSYICSGTCTGCEVQEYAPAVWLEGTTYKMIVHSNDPGDNCTNNELNFFDYMFYTQSSLPISGYINPVRVICPSDTLQGCFDLCTDDFCTPSTSCPPSPTLCDPNVEDVVHVGDPTVVKVDGTYYLYYNAPIKETPGDYQGEQIYLATSYDGLTWRKYPCWAGDTTCTQAPEPVIAFPQAERDDNVGCPLNYGRKQASVIYKDSKFIIVYTYNVCQSIYDWSHLPTWTGLEVNLYRAESTNGYDFGSLLTHTPLYPILPQVDVGDMTDADLFYYPSWDTYFLISGNIGDHDLYWNSSRDGKHWLAHTSADPPRVINGNALADINHNASWLRSTTGSGYTNTYAYYGAGPELTNDNCITQHAFLKWDIHASTVTIQPETLTGNFDGVDTSCIAYGWAYDPDRGTNDDGANDYDDDGDTNRSNALGNHTQVRVYSDNILKGTFDANIYRCDPQAAGITPDCYHGYEINLSSILSPGVQTVQIRGVEFPFLSSETNLHGTIDVDIGNCALQEASPPGSSNPLLITKDAGSSTGYYLNFNDTINARGYNLYEGDLGTYYNHGSTTNSCNISKQTTAQPGQLRHELDASAGNHYYLLTAYSGPQESTPGNATSGPRPTSQSVCDP